MLFPKPVLLRRQDDPPAGGGISDTTTVPLTGLSATTPAPAAAVAEPPARPGESFTRDQVYAEDGKAWRAKFYGAKGELTQKEAALNEQIGSLEASVALLKETKSHLEAKAADMETKLAKATEVLEKVPGLQQQLGELASKSEQASRLEALLKHPQVLALTVTQEVDGQQVSTSPILDLVKASTLDAGQLETTLAQIAAALPVVPGVPAPAPTVPPQPVPTGGDDISALRARGAELQARISSGDSSVMEEMLEIGTKIRRLESGQS